MDINSSSGQENFRIRRDAHIKRSLGVTVGSTTPLSKLVLLGSGKVIGRQSERWVRINSVSRSTCRLCPAHLDFAKLQIFLVPKHVCPLECRP
jgi:hypothetical protein